MKDIKVLSLFSGGGGLDIGFIKAGFNIVASVEIEEKFCRTLELNKDRYFGKNHKTICADISLLQPEELPVSEVDFIIGGPPCQSFSAAGRRAGGVYGINDARGSLFWHFCRFIKHFNPEGFLFENVRGLLQSNKKRDWEIIKASFEELGYTLSYRVLDAADYGVPQHRERLIVVGLKNKTFLFPRPTHGPDSPTKQPYVSVGEALADIDDPNEIVPPYGGKYGDLVAEVPPGMNYLYFTEKMGHPNPRFAWRSKFSDFLYKADPKAPCKTIVASQGRYGGPFHWKGRKFTIPELKRIQSFPDDYEIYGSYNLALKQIGNSVAPKFAEIIAKCIMNQAFNPNQYNDIPVLQNDEKLSFDYRKSLKARKTREKTKQEETAFIQLSLFEENVDSFNEQIAFEKVWFYERPRLKVEHAKELSHEAYGSYLLKFELEKGICEIDIEKRNVTKSINLTLDISFNYPIANRLIRIKSNLATNSLWDIFVAWDAAHYAVSQFTSYEDLQPLYGHFTEPYPKFSVTLDVKGKHDDIGLGKFLEKVTDFKYLTYEHPIEELQSLFQEKDHLELVKKLRYIGFDIRVHQTNRTIPEGYFKICYPFTLSSQALTFVPWIDIGEHKTADFKFSI